MKAKYKSLIHVAGHSLGGAVCAGAILLIASSVEAQNLFVTTGTNVIEITPGGVQSTFATGFVQPTALAFDTAGNLYLSDCAGNNSQIGYDPMGYVYKFTPGGVRSTFAANPLEFPVGLAFDSAGNLYVGDGGGNDGVYRFTPNGIVTTNFYHTSTGPYGIAFDNAGDMFATIDASGSIYEFTNGIETEQGIFTSGLSSPLGLAFDNAGNLYETDQGSGRIYEFTNGAAVKQGIFASSLNAPAGLAFDSAGDLFEADAGSGNIYEFTNGIASEKGTFATGLISPVGIAFAPNLTPPLPFTYTTNNGSITITGYTGTNAAVTIPSTINGLPVTGISNGAFSPSSSLTSLIIPNSVSSIGYDAFSECYNLTNVTIGSGVTNIGFAAFFDDFSLTSITIFNGVTSIGAYEFGYCTSLASITIPNSVTSIGGDAFEYCTNLTNIDFAGNAPTPTNDTSVFQNDGSAIAYYLQGATGWGATFDGIPTSVILPPPALGISTYGSQPVIIYPSSGTNFVLQMTTNLSTGPWVTVSNGVPFFGVQITNGPGTAFFRLH
jgi:sugar lactone lactonase YvrE